MNGDFLQDSAALQQERQTDNDFYIGWMPAAPKLISRHARKMLMLIFLIMIVVAVLLSSSQKKFSTSNFEFGQLVQIKGVYQQFPVPSLYVISSGDVFGKNSFITIPLVGYGKHGADGVIEYLERQKGFSLNDRTITLKGSLLYSDGKTLLQVDKNDEPLVSVETNAKVPRNHVVEELGVLNLKGEIIDPKCYFGVMKPGQGKPHRDCAIRCIEGGINPVFYIRDEKGNTNYCILLGSKGERINAQVKDVVADPVALRARAVKYDDWIVLYVDPAKDLERISGASFIKKQEEIIDCNPLHN